MPASPDRIADVRAAAARAGAQAGFDAGRVADLKTVVTEAVTNAIRHAYAGDEGPIDVAIEPRQGGVGVTVTDEGTGIQPRPAIGASSARLGLLLIAALSSSVEIRSRPRGGTELRMSLSADEASAA